MACTHRESVVCPECGSCTCPRDEHGLPSLVYTECPLHGCGSKHARGER